MARERNRIALHEKFCELLGSRNVYFQPPSNIHMNYPCIVYYANPVYKFHADNTRYLVWYQYKVQIIAHDPDFQLFDTFPDNFSFCSESGARFAKDNLNHANYTLYD